MRARHPMRRLLSGLGLLLAVVAALTAAVTAPVPLAVLVTALAIVHVLQAVLVRRSAAWLRVQAVENERAALHDPVTELPNRVLFHQRVHKAASLAGRHGREVAVLLLDLDRFKEVNDTLGHHNGDVLLHTVGSRIGAVLRESDCVARFGGDEFAVLLAEVDGADGARRAADRVRAAVAERLELEGVGVEVEASVGIAMFPDHGEDPELLLQRADVAMYVAKRAHTGVALYTADVDAYSRERLGLVSDLRRAIAAGELVLHFQPKAALATDSVEGVEALVRWQHPERGLLYPDTFIPLAEHTGLMRPLTLEVLDQALRQCRAWRDAGLRLTVAVNVSARDLLDLSLPDDVAGLLARHDVPAAAIELEITETTIMTDPARAQTVLERLGTLGVGLAIDDFGTGYTSLSWLRDLPVTTLKIDRSFVMDMVRKREDSLIVSSTVQLGRSLGLRVVAEGVEDAGAWSALGELGCDLAQGYFLSRPQPAEPLTRWLVERNDRAASSTSSTGGLSAELTA